MPPLPSSPSPSTENKLRIRDNQRRSRARRAQRLAELQARVRTYEQQGVLATQEVQRAARRIAVENKRLRGLLARVGVSGEEVEAWLRGFEDGGREVGDWGVRVGKEMEMGFLNRHHHHHHSLPGAVRGEGGRGQGVLHENSHPPTLNPSPPSPPSPQPQPPPTNTPSPPPACPNTLTCFCPPSPPPPPLPPRSQPPPNPSCLPTTTTSPQEISCTHAARIISSMRLNLGHHLSPYPTYPYAHHPSHAPSSPLGVEHGVENSSYWTRAWEGAGGTWEEEEEEAKHRREIYAELGCFDGKNGSLISSVPSSARTGGEGRRRTQSMMRCKQTPAHQHSHTHRHTNADEDKEAEEEEKEEVTCTVKTSIVLSVLGRVV